MLRLTSPTLIVCAVIVLTGFGLASAQDAGALSYGEIASGTIDNAAPERVYRFAAQAGDAITVTLTATSGDLDPLLILADENGNVITQDDDSGGNRNSKIVYTVQAAGEYQIIATRYDRASGTTRGDYELALAAQTTTTQPAATDEFGAPPDLGAFAYEMITYGDAVAGAIDDDQVAGTYAFQGRAGETALIGVQRTDGDLALRAALFDRAGRNALVEVEDADDAGRVEIRYILPETAYYVIGVGRMEAGDGAATAGAYELTLDVVRTPAQPPTEAPTLQPTEASPGMEITLRWNSIADLDLVLYYPSEGENAASIDWQHIAYPNQFALPPGAAFDTDANGFCQNLTPQPVERITWEAGAAPAGDYEILVLYQFSCGSAETSTPFELTLALGGETQTITGAVDAPKGKYRTTFTR